MKLGLNASWAGYETIYNDCKLLSSGYRPDFLAIAGALKIDVMRFSSTDGYYRWRYTIGPPPGLDCHDNEDSNPGQVKAHSVK